MRKLSPLPALFILLLLSTSSAQPAPVGVLHGPVPVLNVMDGDTIVLWSNLGPRIVRLIGIDAPELDRRNPTGHVAADRLRTKLPIGTNAWVETDMNLEDIYGRLLAYVYVEDPAGEWQIGPHRVTQLNLFMAETGWARTMDIAPNSTYADLYHHAADQASSAGLGMWSDQDTPAAAFMPAGPISIACVLYNPDTPNDANAEIVFLHLSENMDTRGYYLFDEGSAVRLPLPLGMQPAGELEVLNPGQGIWNNGGDTIYLMVGDTLVDSWTYEGGFHPVNAILCRDGSIR